MSETAESDGRDGDDGAATAGSSDGFRAVADDGREDLKRAIVACTRAEVVRVLNDLLGGGGRDVVVPRRRADGPSPSIASSEDAGAARDASRRPRRAARPRTAVEASSSSAARRRRPEGGARRRPATSRANATEDEPAAPASSSSLRLEAGDGEEEARGISIDRSSSTLLRRSSAVVEEATGEPPKRYRDAFGGREGPASTADASSEAADEDPLEPDERFQDHDESAGDKEGEDDDEKGRAELSRPPDDFRPITAVRLLHTSHSVLRNKPSDRRPLTTTALERRKPPPSTAASERSKAREIGRRLLGPIALEPGRPSCRDAVLPNSLADGEWENELARNIVNVFANKARDEIRTAGGTRGPLGDGGGGGGGDGTQSAPPAEDDPFFSDEVAFRGRDFVRRDEGGGEDFQRISVSRGATCADEFFPEEEGPEEGAEGVAKIERAGGGGARDGPLKPRMIWFTGTGVVQANWEPINALDLDNYLDCDELLDLEEQGRYMRYVGLVEASILRWNNKTFHQEDHSEMKRKLWRQLVVSCNCFATRLIEKRKYSKAMEMLERTVSFIGSELGFLPEHTCEELTAMVKDTYAYYYIRRSKPSASYQYLISAINNYKRRRDALNVAKCRLHQSFILCAQHKYSDSMESLKKILTMVERGALDVEGDYNQVLLLTSVAYHNIAVQQLMLGHVSDACVSSQNARRLARLCLSVSGHYLPTLESTHKQSLNELSTVLKNSHCDEKATLFRNLISELFD